MFFFHAQRVPFNAVTLQYVPRAGRAGDKYMLGGTSCRPAVKTLAI